MAFLSRRNSSRLRYHMLTLNLLLLGGHLLIPVGNLLCLMSSMPCFAITPGHWFFVLPTSTLSAVGGVFASNTTRTGRSIGSKPASWPKALLNDPGLITMKHTALF
ncbi:unnamed protein product [Linum tenue]|uniref:Uncharacterized protein n=1 Tax=Linum tenue TaxID=586396 RepID=A0AAV0NK26_9ROSI|nr:unnamed protein product [Linum tenue]